MKIVVVVRGRQRGRHGNEMIGDGGVTESIQSLDSTLFQYNMRGWFDMQKHIRTHAESFKFFKMNTSGHMGFMMLCKNCTRVCKISWPKKLNWDDDVLETNRVQLRDFLGFGTHLKIKSDVLLGHLRPSRAWYGGMGMNPRRTILWHLTEFMTDAHLSRIRMSLRRKLSDTALQSIHSSMDSRQTLLQDKAAKERTLLQEKADEERERTGKETIQSFVKKFSFRRSVLASGQGP